MKKILFSVGLVVAGYALMWAIKNAKKIKVSDIDDAFELGVGA